MEVINEYGVCVIPNIFTEDECVGLRDQIWSGLSHITKNKFDVKKEESWVNFFDMKPLHSMMIQNYSVASMQPVWNIRQDPRIGEIFSKIWSIPKEELLSSFDAISANLPPEKVGQGFWQGDDWLHTDQSPLRKGYHCVQGMVNLYPVQEGDATLSVLEKSHNLHQSFFESIGYSGKNDWYRLKQGEKNYFIDNGCRQYCVTAPIGSIILWDSRTIHQGIEASAARVEENFRMVVYTCLLPRSTFSKADLNKRQKAFDEMRLTNHWGTKLFPNVVCPEGLQSIVEKPVLTEYGKKLVA
jgi:hypothetical protein